MNEKKNKTMDELLAKAKVETTNKSYQSAELEEDPKAVKEKSEAGRKKVKASQKKKARQVFYSDEEFAEIEKCAEIEILDTKAFMQRAINKEIKAVLSAMKED